MSGNEMKFVQEAFDTNWVVPLGPNVNGFEKDLEEFVNRREISPRASLGRNDKEATLGRNDKEATLGRNDKLEKRVLALSSGTAAVHLGLLACGVGPGRRGAGAELHVLRIDASDYVSGGDAGDD